MGVNAIVEKIRTRLQGSGFDRSVRFDLGGGESIFIDGDTVSASEGEAECVISISAENLQQMMSGDLDPMAAFMSGKLKVHGDMSAAMALTQAI